MFWTIIISLFALFASLIVNSAQDVLISLPISVRASSGGVELQTLKVNHRDSLVAKVEAFCRQHRISDIETYNNIFSYTLDSIRQGNPKLVAMEITGSFIPPYLQPMKNLTFFFKPYGSFRTFDADVSDLVQHSVYEGDLKEKIFSDVLHRSWIIVYTALYVDSDEHHTFDIVTQAAVLYDLAKDVKLQPTPFPHISIDGIFPVQYLRKVVKEFPRHAIGDPIAPHWQASHVAVQNKKLQCTTEHCMGSATRNLIYQLKSGIFVEFLEKLTGVKNLIPDPNYYGSGLHQIQRGGHLSIHADFIHHKPIRSLRRRVNVFLYLNEDWNSAEWVWCLIVNFYFAIFIINTVACSILGRESRIIWYGWNYLRGYYRTSFRKTCRLFDFQSKLSWASGPSLVSTGGDKKVDSVIFLFDVDSGRACRRYLSMSGSREPRTM